MEIKYIDEGRGNKIAIGTGVKGQPKISVMGNNNRLNIGDDALLNTSVIEIRGSNCCIEIGKACKLQGAFRVRASFSNLFIGANTSTMNAMISLHESGTISIGMDCMFSGDVRMDVSDMHSILDFETGQRINPAKDIYIGDHVWLAQGVTVGKGARINSGCVVGAKSLVLGEVPENSVAAGVPARVLKNGVKWIRERV